MRNFLTHSDDDRQAMLQAIGLHSTDELFADIPQTLRDQAVLNRLPPTGASEWELEEELTRLANANTGSQYISFMGGGAYHRFIPPAVNTIAGRSEFATSYTPYQPEVSQGTLQVIYEFQSMMAELTGLDVVNASVYDTASAVTEAALMALRIQRKRNTILIAKGIHPDCREVAHTYIKSYGQANLVEFDPMDGPQALQQVDGSDVAALILQQPNYFGAILDPKPWQEYCQTSGALLVVSADPVSLALLEPPGHYGADIVVGDIQPLGNNIAFGGPYGGFIATRQAHVRQLPGRLVGRSVDGRGRPCYTLTLQTREQHIRRAKATSNICTNQALNVLKATVYLSIVGPQGLYEVANLSVQRAHYLAKALTEFPDVHLTFPQHAFGFEFALTLPVPVQPVLDALAKEGILGGIAVERFYPEYPNTLLIAVTECNSRAQLDRYVEVFGEALGKSASNLQPASSSSTPARRPLSSV